MAIDKNIRLAVKAKLRTGAKPKDVAASMEIPLTTVYSIKKEIEQEVANETVSELATIPEEIVTAVVEKAKESSPELSSVLDSVQVSADGLRKLDAKFQETTVKGLKVLDRYLDDPNISLNEVHSIMLTTATAYDKIFSKGTNIHIGDNNNNNNQLTIFKNKMGV
jgi:hypothetical protein